jgi:hypothetical protein
VRNLLIAMLMLASGGPAGGAETPKADPLEPVRFLVGQWRGTVEGQSGTGTVERTYERVLNGRFIEERNVTTYPPQEKNKGGEVHEHRSFLSYDRQKKTLMLRQFHEESFVNLYAHDPAAGSATRLVFDSVSFENFDNAWKARETYELVSADEFVETFELAPPGKPFEVYSRNRLVRLSPLEPR